MDQHHHITTHHHKSPHHTYCSWVQHKQQKQQKQHQQHQQHVKLATVVATVDQQLAHTAYACTDRLPSSQIGSMGSMGSMVAHGSTFLQLQHVLAAHCSTCDMQLRSERIQPDNTRTHTLDQVPLSSVPCPLQRHGRANRRALLWAALCAPVQINTGAKNKSNTTSSTPHTAHGICYVVPFHMPYLLFSSLASGLPLPLPSPLAPGFDFPKPKLPKTFQSGPSWLV
jgi:hypothetical protein